jgi:DNA-binding LytR/AlgR family response regulator
MKNERCIIIDKGTTFHSIAISHLVYVEADGNYSDFKMRDSNNDFTLTMQLGEVHELMDKTRGVDNFIRVGRSLIVNLNYVRSIDLSKDKFLLSDNFGFRKELDASHPALLTLKSIVEKRAKKIRRNEDEY